MSDDNQGETEKVLSFTEHLEELRWRIIACVVAFVLLLVGAFVFTPRVMDFLIQPISTLPKAPSADRVTLALDDSGFLKVKGSAAEARDLVTSLSASRHSVTIALELGPEAPPLEFTTRSRSSLFFLSPIEPFTLMVKAAILVSLIFTIPIVAYNIWRFVAPGLLRKERRIIGPVILSSLLLFPSGALFAYFLTGLALRFLLGFGVETLGLEPNIVASEYLNFLLTLMIVFGVFFEFPLVLVLLARMGAIDSRFLSEKRKFAILIITVAAAVATPTPDPFTMMALVVPLVLLYEGALVIIRLLEKAAAAPRPAGSE